MLRLFGFFVLVYVLVSFLRTLPVIGPFFGHFFAFWIVAIALSLALDRLAGAALQGRKLGGELERLGAVDSPHNMGKLGGLLLAHGRARKALEPLEAAAAGEPEVAEWHYRLGQARLATGALEGAVAALSRAAEIDDEHAYGGVQLALADAHARRGNSEGALAALDVFERNHGPNPESAYRRGRTLRALGRREEARTSFATAIALGSKAARFKAAENRPWVLRAHLARLAA